MARPRVGKSLSELWDFLVGTARARPDACAAVDGSRRFTWRETHARVVALAISLRSRGLNPSDRVAVLDHNSIEVIELTFAAAGAGLVLCPLNPRLTARELADILTDAEPRLLFHRTAQAERVSAALARIPRAHPRPTPLRIEDPSAALDSDPQSGPFLPHPARPEEVAQLYYTSGTSGRSKGVMLTHGNLAAHARACVGELQLSSSDVWGHFAPLFHLADAWATLAITLAGGRHVLVPKFEAQAVLQSLREEAVTLTNLVPTMIVRLLEAARNDPPGPLALRLCLSGGAPIAPAVVLRLIEQLGCDYAQTYGMTETCPFLTISSLAPHHAALSEEDRLIKRSKTGRAFAGVELEVVDEQGQLVPHDERSVGEIRVRGASVSPGYWKRPQETAAAFREGWLWTGDLAVVDEEGYLTIVDRKKDVILSGGETIYSTEVEKALHEHPDLLEAAAFGLPDAEWGEVVCAALVLRPGCRVDDDQLMRHLRERLAGFKCPRRLFRLDALPRTASGKIKKADLRSDYSPR